MLWNGERGNCYNIGRGQAHEELTTAQRIFSNRLSELAGFQRHAETLPSEVKTSKQQHPVLLATCQSQHRGQSKRDRSVIYSSVNDSFGPSAHTQTIAAKTQISAA